MQTRIQNQNFESKVGGMTVVRELIKNEGFSAFFKGLTPKVLYVASPTCGQASDVLAVPSARWSQGGTRQECEGDAQGGISSLTPFPLLSLLPVLQRRRSQAYLFLHVGPDAYSSLLLLSPAFTSPSHMPILTHFLARRYV